MEKRNQYIGISTRLIRNIDQKERMTRGPENKGTTYRETIGYNIGDKWVLGGKKVGEKVCV